MKWLYTYAKSQFTGFWELAKEKGNEFIHWIDSLLEKNSSRGCGLFVGIAFPIVGLAILAYIAIPFTGLVTVVLTSIGGIAWSIVKKFRKD